MFSLTQLIPLTNPLFRVAGSTADSWQPGNYDNTGNLCNCTAEFEQATEGQNRTCDACRGAGFNQELCACNEQPDPPLPPIGQCSSGPCCNVAQKTFRPAGELCRRAERSCEAYSTCTGDSADCPKVVAPNGKPCAYTIWDQGDFFWPGAAIAAATDRPRAAVQATQDTKAGAASARRLREPQYGASEDTEEPHRQYKYEKRQYKDSHHHNPQPYQPDDDSPVHRWPRHTYKEEGEGDATDDSYGNNRHEDHSSGYGSQGWPECWGTCSAGECKLEQSAPGCCQLSRAHGKGYASAAAVGGSSGDAQAAAASADGVSSSVGGVSYKEEGDSNLVCWRGAEGQRV